MAIPTATHTKKTIQCNIGAVSQLALQTLHRQFRNDNCLNHLATIKYGTECNSEISKLALRRDPRIRSDYRCREPSLFFPTYYDLRFPHYDINQHSCGFFVSSGPDPQMMGSVEKFITDLFFNPYLDTPIKCIIIAGEPNGIADDPYSKFVDYFSRSNVFGKFNVETTHLTDLSADNIQAFNLQITDIESRTSVSLVVYQIINMPDHGVPPFTDADISLLYNLIKKYRSDEIVCHCAAGLGRSNTILFALHLFKNFRDFLGISSDKLAEKILSALNTFRSVRPAAVRNEKQLHFAINLAIRLKEFEWKHNHEITKAEVALIPVVAMLGTFDSKLEIYTLLYTSLVNRGIIVIAVNAGVFPVAAPHPFPITVSTEEIMGDASIQLQELRELKDRPRAMDAIGKAVRLNFASIYAKYGVVAIVGFGGTNGTALIKDAAVSIDTILEKKCPIICGSTVARFDTSQYAIPNNGEMVFIHPVADFTSKLCTLNVKTCNQMVDYVCTRAFAKQTRRFKKQFSMNSSLFPEAKKPRIAISMFGNTTKCVEAIQQLLCPSKDDPKYDIEVFHADGVCDNDLEKRVTREKFAFVLDITPHPIIDKIAGGVFVAEPGRYEAPGKYHVPHVITPGCLDMINYVRYEKASKDFPGRRLKKCNENVTVIRANEEESKKAGEYLAGIANACLLNQSGIAIIIPARGISMFDQYDPEWYNAKANFVLFSTILSKTDPSVPIIIMDNFINDADFSAKCVAVTLDLIGNKPIISECLLATESDLTNLFKLHVSSNGRGLPFE